MGKYIETALPLAEINDAAIREKAGKRGHPANLHMWWGRSPEASSLAALAAAVMDFTAETSERDLALIAKTASGDKEALETIRSSLKERASLPTVWDAFAGFGGIPIAAQKLGLRAVANDLNPVAAMLTRAVADIPARFAGQPPVHPGKLKRTAYSGAQGLAEDVQFYGEWLENQALKLLSDAYPQTESGEIPFAWIWVRTVKCPNPACNCHIPLGSSYILSKSKTAQYWAEPVMENGELNFEIHEGECPKDKESNKVSGNGARFRCPACGEITTDEYIKKMGAAHALGAQMLAVVTNTNGKKCFLVPSEIQKAAAEVEMPEEIPPGAIPTNAHWFSPPGFGITEYADLFTPRQMQMLCTFSDLVRKAQDMAASSALAAGMSETGGSLEAGGLAHWPTVRPLVCIWPLWWTRWRTITAPCVPGGRLGAISAAPLAVRLSRWSGLLRRGIPFPACRATSRLCLAVWQKVWNIWAAAARQLCHRKMLSRWSIRKTSWYAQSCHTTGI